jgi:1-acylglycerone phosphate reductase
MSTAPNPAPVYILITGISPGGLGDALTTELLKNPNTHILAIGLSLTHLSHLPSSPRISKLELDVTSPTSISTALTTVTTITHGRLNYLISNAGYGYMMPLLDADPQAVRKNFDVNVFGLLAVTQAFFPLLREAKGTVVNQCSIASLPGGRQPFIGTYCATKAAVASLNDTMRVEFEPFGVKVSSCYMMLRAIVYLASNANVTTCRSSV